jgi:hypothetical protein
MLWLLPLAPAHALVIASSDIAFSSLGVAPSGGTLVLVSASTFAQAQNSLGDLDAQFDASGASASASAGVTYASAQAQAAGLSGSASALVNLPSSIDAAANSQALSSLLATFMITGGVGPVDVSFDALVVYALAVQTDTSGVLGEAEAIFLLQVDGTPVLFFQDLLSAGPPLCCPGPTASRCLERSPCSMTRFTLWS